MDMTLLKALELNARRFPHKKAIVFEGEDLTYRELYSRTVAFMEQLNDIGIGPSQKVAIVSENHPTFLSAVVAITGIGGIPVLVNYRLAAGDALQVIANADCRAMILGAGQEDFARRRSDTITHYFAMDEGSRDQQLGLLTIRRSAVGISKDLGRHAHSQIMCHTSGTTGLPKGVLRSKMGFLERSVQFGISAENTFLCALPVCLSAGITFGLWALYIGSTLHLHRRVDYSSIIQDVAQNNVNLLFLLPNMLNQLIADPLFESADLSSVRCIITGGGYLTESLRTTLRNKLGDVLTLFYGSSEIGSCTCLSAKELAERYHDNCIGRPFFGTEVVILDENNVEVPTGEIGRICARSNMQLDDYNGDASSLKDLTAGDYLSVGDMGRFDDAGLLYFVGRQRDFIRTGGINVPSGDVETALANHPAVSEVYCVGVPDRTWGEAICAVVIPTSRDVSAAEILDYAAEVLPGYKKPKHVVFVQEVPKNLAGRVLKHELGEIVIAKLTKENPQ